MYEIQNFQRMTLQKMNEYLTNEKGLQTPHQVQLRLLGVLKS